MMRKLALLTMITLCAAAPLPNANAAPLDQKTLDAIAKRIYMSFYTHGIQYTIAQVNDYLEVTITDHLQYINADAFLAGVCLDKQSPCTVKMLPAYKIRVTPTPAH